MCGILVFGCVLPSASASSSSHRSSTPLTHTQLTHTGTYGTGLALVTRLGPVWRRGRCGRLRGRRGTYGTGLALVTRLGPFGPRSLRPLCVAGVALGDIDLHFAWQAWRLVTSTVALRGRRGTGWHGPSLCVAGVTLMRLGWLWERAWVPFGAGVVVALSVASSLRVAGVALGDHLHFARQAWHLATSTFVLRGRCGTWRQPPSFYMFYVAGVALVALCWLCSRVTHSIVTHHFVNTTLSHTIFPTQLCHTPSLSHTTFHTQLCHTPSFPHNFVTYHLSHTSLSHTIFHTQFCHTPSFTYNFVIHHLSHTTLSYTIFHTHLYHTPSFTHIFVTHHLSHTSLSHAICHTHLCHTSFFTHIFVTRHLSHTHLCHTSSFTPSLTHIFATHHLSHTQLCHTPSSTHNFVTHHLSHTHTHLGYTPPFTHILVTHHLSHTTLHIQPFNSSILRHLLCLSFPVPLELFVSAYWKMLTCGVFRSFNPTTPSPDTHIKTLGTNQTMKSSWGTRIRNKQYKQSVLSIKMNPSNRVSNLELFSKWHRDQLKRKLTHLKFPKHGNLDLFIYWGS